MVTETVTNLANKAISQREQAGNHPLKLSAESRAADDADAPESQVESSWEQPPMEQRATAKSNVDVYLDNLILVVQGGPRER